MNDHKIVLIIKNDLQSWQKLNVAAFLASSVAIQFPQTHGAAFVNASGSAYSPFIKHPILIYKAETNEEMNRAFNRAKERGLHMGIYTELLFATKNEAENHVEVAKNTDQNQVLVGIALYGEAKPVDKAIDKLKRHD